MSLYTNDLDAVKTSFMDGTIFLIDAVVLGGLAMYKMFKMNWLLTVICIVPLAACCSLWWGNW